MLTLFGLSTPSLALTSRSLGFRVVLIVLIDAQRLWLSKFETDATTVRTDGRGLSGVHFSGRKHFKSGIVNSIHRARGDGESGGFIDSVSGTLRTDGEFVLLLLQSSSCSTLTTVLLLLRPNVFVVVTVLVPFDTRASLSRRA